MKKLAIFMFSQACVFVLFGAIIGYNIQRPQPDADLQTCYGALPVDQGQVTINTLEPDGHGVLVLHTQRLKNERYQSVQIPINKD